MLTRQVRVLFEGTQIGPERDVAAATDQLRVASTSVLGVLRDNYRKTVGPRSGMEGLIFGDEMKRGCLIVKDNFEFEGTPVQRQFVQLDARTSTVVPHSTRVFDGIPPQSTVIGSIGIRDDTPQQARSIIDSLVQSLKHSELRLGPKQHLGYGRIRFEVLDLAPMGEIFISYTWEDDEHSEWVWSISDRLSRLGFKVLVDQFDLTPGKNLHFFMERAIEDSEKVLLILTPTFKEKASKRQGGAGYEFSMIVSELVENLSGNNKFIPVLRRGSAKESIPIMFKPYLYCDARGDDFERVVSDLTSAVLENPLKVRPEHNKY